MTTPCYICGTGMELVSLDPRDMKTKPCTHCEDVITETVGGRGDDSIMTWGEFASILSTDAEMEQVSNDVQTSLGNT